MFQISYQIFLCDLSFDGVDVLFFTFLEFLYLVRLLFHHFSPPLFVYFISSYFILPSCQFPYRLLFHETIEYHILPIWRYTLFLSVAGFILVFNTVLATWCQSSSIRGPGSGVFRKEDSSNSVSNKQTIKLLLVGCYAVSTDKYWVFRIIYYRHVGTEFSFEMSVITYQPTRSNIRKDLSSLIQNRCENCLSLKSLFTVLVTSSLQTTNKRGNVRIHATHRRFIQMIVVVEKQ